MTGWGAYGLERCEKCGELFTWNDYYFPAIRDKVCICKDCMEQLYKEPKK